MKKGHILSPRINSKRGGYCEIMLFKNNVGKRFKIHRLVATEFLNNPHDKPEVNHIDGNKSNNCVDNLEWVTSKENKAHAWNAGLINSEHKKVKIYCFENGKTYDSVEEASKKLNCDRRSIFRQLKGEKVKVKGFSFKRV